MAPAAAGNLKDGLGCWRGVGLALVAWWVFYPKLHFTCSPAPALTFSPAPIASTSSAAIPELVWDSLRARAVCAPRDAGVA